MKELLKIMQQLRDPETGCSWDRKQTFESIFPYTLEEVHEVGDAIDRADMNDLKGELGDLLFQVVFYAQMAEERGDFNFQDVVNGISEKMVRRHPHVFGNKVYATEADQKADWEAIKKQERKQTVDKNIDKSADSNNELSKADDAFADIALRLTALQRGQKVLNRAGDHGFDWKDWKPIIDKVYEEVDEIIEAVEDGEPQHRIEEEVGDLFIVVTNLARHLNVDAENAARKATNKFAKRFNRMMELVHARYPDCEQLTLEQMDQGWENVKKEEKSKEKEKETREG